MGFILVFVSDAIVMDLGLRWLWVLALPWSPWSFGLLVVLDTVLVLNGIGFSLVFVSDATVQTSSLSLSKMVLGLRMIWALILSWSCLL